MNGYEVTTAHNVTLRYSYASIGDRVLAYLLDTLIKTGYIIAVGVLIAVLISAKIATKDFLALWIILGFIAALPVIFYSLLFEYMTAGQTPGKRAMKIKVASLDTEQLSFGKCFIRWIFRIIDFGMCYGAIAVVATSVSDKKQRIGDLVAGTIVVSLKSEKTLGQTIYAYVEQGREAHYPQASQLSAREAEIIKEVLRQYEQEGKFDLVPITAARVREAIGAPVDMDDLRFLRTIIEDYYILAGKD
jgi:uncharacterized RDD family membrane protein YckC